MPIEAIDNATRIDRGSVIGDLRIEDDHRLGHLRPQRSCGRTPSAKKVRGLVILP